MEVNRTFADPRIRPRPLRHSEERGGHWNPRNHHYGGKYEHLPEHELNQRRQIKTESLQESRNLPMLEDDMVVKNSFSRWSPGNSIPSNVFQLKDQVPCKDLSAPQMRSGPVFNSRQHSDNHYQPKDVNTFTNYPSSFHPFNNFALDPAMQQCNARGPTSIEPIQSILNDHFAFIPNLPLYSKNVYHGRYPFQPPVLSPPVPRTSLPSFANASSQSFEVMLPDCNPNSKMVSNDLQSADKKFIKDWLQKRNLEEKAFVKPHYKSPMKIKDGKKKMADYIDSIDKLITYQDTLKKAKDAGENEWSEIVRQTLCIKQKVSRVQSDLFSEDFVVNLSTMIKNRRKRRDRQRTLRKKRSNEKLMQKKKSSILHQRIDDWRHNILSEINAKKLSDSMKSEAGKSLIEVHRKQSESVKLLEKLTHANDLRRIRRETALQRGIFVFGKEDEKFENRVEKLIELIESRLDVYKDEEKTLLVMLEEEKEQIQREDDKEMKRLMRNEYLRLFGFDPQLECQRYWLQAFENPAALTKIRRLWDVYIVPGTIPGADHIPDGWVDPQCGGNPSWNTYLNRNETYM